MNKSAFQLLMAIRCHLRKESFEHRSQMVRIYLQRWPLLLPIYDQFNRQSPSFKALIALLYASCTARLKRLSASRNVAFYALPNEARSIKEVTTHFPEEVPVRPIHRLNVTASVLKSKIDFFRNFRKMKRIYSILRRLSAKHELYLVMRSAQTIFYFKVFDDLFQSPILKTVFYSSDGSPHGSSIMCAATKHQKTLVFCCHGAVSADPNRIHADLAIFQGEKGLESYRQAGADFDHTIFYPTLAKKPEISHPISQSSALICLSKDTSVSNVQEVVVELKRLQFKRIRIRPHPHSLVDIQKYAAIAELQQSTYLMENLIESEVIVAGNSNIHLDAFVHGHQSIFCPTLDPFGSEVLAFLREGIFPELKEIQISKSLPADFWNQENYDLISKYWHLGSSSQDFSNQLKGWWEKRKPN